MKTMTCRQLGGACDKEFSADSFEEMTDLGREHGMEMYMNGDEDHVHTIEELREHLADPHAMNAWLSKIKMEYDRLPHN